MISVFARHELFDFVCCLACSFCCCELVHKVSSVEVFTFQAYCNAIRKAQRFIYLETEPFHCSASSVVSDEVAELCLLLSQRIADSVRSEQPVFVVIVLPMWPEHEKSPLDSSVYAAVRRQRVAIDHLITTTEAALKKVPGTHNASDYLAVFCLGNKATEPFVGVSESAHARIAQLRREKAYKVHVHSKLLIVDDEYIVIGSASCTDRALSGEHDTELAVGAFEFRDNAEVANRSIRDFRRGLFEEHIGEWKDYNGGVVSESGVWQPTVDFVCYFRDVAKHNHMAYTGREQRTTAAAEGKDEKDGKEGKRSEVSDRKDAKAEKDHKGSPAATRAPMSGHQLPYACSFVDGRLDLPHLPPLHFDPHSGSHTSSALDMCLRIIS